MTAGKGVEIVPGRFTRSTVAVRVDLAASRIRADLAKGRGSVVVDETDASSAVLRDMMAEFGVPRARRWNPDLIENPQEAARRVAEESKFPSAVADRHLAQSLAEMSTERPPIVLIVNPAEDSPAAVDAARLGADVYLLPRRRTSLPVEIGSVVPWRRAIDLTPLLVVLKPADAAEWRGEYHRAAPAENHTVREPPVILHRVAEAVAAPMIRDSPQFIDRGHRGGRLTLATVPIDSVIASTSDEPSSVMARLGISTTLFRDSDEWVIGGTMIRHDRALQVTRGDVDGQLNIQLVWGGPDPRTYDIVRIEDKLVEILGSAQP